MGNTNVKCTKLSVYVCVCVCACACVNKQNKQRKFKRTYMPLRYSQCTAVFSPLLPYSTVPYILNFLVLLNFLSSNHRTTIVMLSWFYPQPTIKYHTTSQPITRVRERIRKINIENAWLEIKGGKSYAAKQDEARY